MVVGTDANRILIGSLSDVLNDYGFYASDLEANCSMNKSFTLRGRAIFV